MSTKQIMCLLSTAMLTGVIALSGCASDTMKPMGDSMDKSMMGGSMHDAKEKPMMEDTMDEDEGMKDSM